MRAGPVGAYFKSMRQLQNLSRDLGRFYDGCNIFAGALILPSRTALSGQLEAVAHVVWGSLLGSLHGEILEACDPSSLVQTDLTNKVL